MREEDNGNGIWSVLYVCDGEIDEVVSVLRERKENAIMGQVK